MLYHERLAKKKGFRVIIGVDEAGRGPLAGPVVVAAVCLKGFKFKERIDDSKKLTRLQRDRAFAEIVRNAFYGVGIVNEEGVDTLNISGATKFAVEAAISRLVRQLKEPRPSVKNTILLLDGLLDSDSGFTFKEIIGGDGKSLSIASASIIAKVFRDRIMDFYDFVYPRYGFKDHKGYGTKRHFKNIVRHGLCPIHRKTFCKAFL